ncbi:MAG: efflux RND transporter permease subunit [Planctomycetota bacterium]|nr:MAG: efflux RND transporter permease subunit [Planctomycetota bacterium]
MAILAAIMVLGALLVPRLPVDIWPSFRSQTIWVHLQVEEGSTDENLDQVTRPLEGLLRGIPGVSGVTTRTRDRHVRAWVSPAEGSDSRSILAAIGDVLGANLHRFPEGMNYRFGSWSNDDSPPIAFAIGAGSLSPGAFEALIEEDLIPAIAAIDGVAAATQGDYDPGQVQIYLERSRMQSAGINPQDLAEQLSALQPRSLSVPLREGGSQWDTVLQLRLDGASQAMLEQLPVGENSRLQEVAVVHRAPPGGDRVVLVNGRPGAVISVFRSPEANGYRVSQRAETTMRQLAEIHRIDLIVPTATHRTINAATVELLGSFVWGACFALLFLWIFLRRLRLTVLVCLAIPMSLSLAVIGLAVSAQAVNIFTIVGFILALGMLVDNSVVVGEAMSRAPGSQQPAQRRRLRHRAVRSVSMAIVLSTLTTIAIIVPFRLLDTGPLSGPVNALATPLIWSLLGSLVVALVITPILFDWWHRRDGAQQQRPARWLAASERIYGRILTVLIRQPALAGLLLLGLVGGPLLLFMNNPSAMSLNAQLETDERRAVLPIIQRTGVPLSRFQEVATIWHQQLLPHLEELGATGIVSEIGGRRSELHIYLQPIDDGLSSDDVANRVADILEPQLDLALQAHIDRAQGEAASSGSLGRPWQRRGGGPPSGVVRVSFVLRHPHAEALPGVWDSLRPQIEALPGVQWLTPPIDAPEPIIEFALTRQAMAAGYTPQNLSWQINRLTGRRTVATLPEGTDLTMGPLRWQSPTLAEIASLNIRAQGVEQRLDAITEMASVAESPSVMRVNSMSEHQIVVSVQEPFRRQLIDTLTNPGFPASAGIHEPMQIGLTWWQQRGEDSREAMLLAIALAGLIVFLLMAFFYESFVAPFAALASVPLALLTVMSWIAWRGEETGAMAAIGCFFLVGIVVNNGIVLVDRLRRAVPPHRASASRRVAAALSGAARRRLAPILLTSLTTICAALPMALGSSRIAGLPVSELGATIAAGLAGATIFTLFVVPLTYYWLARLRSALTPSS